jgi:hypothetical protein
MSKTDAFEFNFLKSIFAGTPITNISASAGTTSWWIGLHTADPGDAGSTANEGGYTEYVRLKTDRSTAASTGWSVTSGTSAAVASASPVTALNFPQSLSTSTGTFTHFSVNQSSNGVGSSAIYTGTITPNINFSQNVTPSLTTGSSITED